jgi:hypothetical protein
MVGVCERGIETLHCIKAGTFPVKQLSVFQRITCSVELAN